MNKLIAAAKLDETAQTEGREVTFSPDGKLKFRYTVYPGGAHNDKLAELIEKEFRPYRQAGTDPNDIAIPEQRAITARCYAAAVMKTWNAEDFGEEFSVENCVKTMLAAPVFLNHVKAQSEANDIFRSKMIGEASGN